MPKMPKLWVLLICKIFLKLIKSILGFNWFVDHFCIKFLCRKQCILSENRFDFLKDLVNSLPDVSGPDEEVPTPPLTPAPMNTNVSNTSTYSPTIQQPDTG